ncbi:MAG TPA: glycogen/starch/alpha-glucan phosphorylase, partial [Methylomirabilota bacterium]|nr:glycogen/starch/alpha-glucan phosphorylase [Methylomirabilota bacterium]
RYVHCADFASYLDCQSRVAAAYLRADDWVRTSIRNVAGMGRFSSDRTVREYARDVWRAVPVPVRFET